MNPDHYLCTVDGEYYKRPVEDYQIGTVDRDVPNVQVRMTRVFHMSKQIFEDIYFI